MLGCIIHCWLQLCISYVLTRSTGIVIFCLLPTRSRFTLTWLCSVYIISLCHITLKKNASISFPFIKLNVPGPGFVIYKYVILFFFDRLVCIFICECVVRLISVSFRRHFDILKSLYIYF